MMRRYTLLYIYIAMTTVTVFSACTHKQQETETVGVIGRDTQRMVGGSVKAMPKATVYRTTKDYRDNVPVTMNEARTEIVSYPAPSDLRCGDGYATPLALRDGYWLDRRGVNANSVFLDYTYAQYASLATAPSTDELKRHIIDKQPFTEMFTLPITTDEAVRDTARCNDIIANGLKGCTEIVKRLPTLSR